MYTGLGVALVQPAIVSKLPIAAIEQTRTLGAAQGIGYCRFRCYPGRFRRPREEGDFVKGRGRTNTHAGNRDHQDRRRR